MALSNGAYCYNFKSDVSFHVTHYVGVTFMFSQMCQWGEDCVFFFVPQKLVKEVPFSHYTPTSVDYQTHYTLRTESFFSIHHTTMHL